MYHIYLKLINQWLEQKVIRQETLIVVAYSSVQFETSSLYAVFVNKNRCISVLLVSDNALVFS